jgi:hypothetical protein
VAARETCQTSSFASVSDADLGRARHDAEFRQKLLSDNLECLLVALNHLRNSNAQDHPDSARQLHEGVTLALKLADLLQRIARQGEASDTS